MRPCQAVPLGRLDAVHAGESVLGSHREKRGDCCRHTNSVESSRKTNRSSSAWRFLLIACNAGSSPKGQRVALLASLPCQMECLSIICIIQIFRGRPLSMDARETWSQALTLRRRALLNDPWRNAALLQRQPLWRSS